MTDKAGTPSTKGKKRRSWLNVWHEAYANDYERYRAKGCSEEIAVSLARINADAYVKAIKIITRYYQIVW